MKNLKTILSLTLISYFPQIVISAENSCQQKTTSIYHINGMYTEREDAEIELKWINSYT